MTKSTSAQRNQDVVNPQSIQASAGSVDEIPSLADKLWLTRIRKLSESSFKACEEGAKGIMTACTFFITVYSFLLSDAQEKSQVVRSSSWLFATPVLFLGVSLITAVMVLIPLRYDASEVSVTKAKRTWENALNDKYRAIWISFICLALGLISLGAVLVVYMGGISP